jgi:hypothetical protein
VSIKLLWVDRTVFDSNENVYIFTKIAYSLKGILGVDATHWDLLEILVWKFKRGNQLVL